MLDITIILKFIGGIGLFLLGMSLMTDSLKAMAGDSLRQWLVRFTGSPMKAMFSGIAFTAMVQSSTATTLATIGFVSAGVLTFAQAIGVIIGANIGTTSIGWIVAFVGLKFSISAFALPMIGLGAMMKLLCKDTLAFLGLVLAGFGLLFLGIDVLQQAMAGFASQVDLSQWSDSSLWTRFLLVIVGLVMTVLLQSSGAAITATLTALATGTIDLPQALALVIGQNIGTVATGIVAAIGATISAKRTAMVHVVFNVVTAVFAFFLLMPATLWLAQMPWFPFDHITIIAIFHTAFSVLGALIFMPFTEKFQAVIERLVPETTPQHTTQYLDESLFAMPALAIATAKRALCDGLAQTFDSLTHASQGKISAQEINVDILDETLATVERYLQKMPVPQAQTDQEHLIELLRLVVYSRVIRDDLQHVDFLDVLRTDSANELLNEFIHHIDRLIHYLSYLPDQGIPETYVQDFIEFGDLTKAKQQQVRLSIIGQSAHASEALDMIVAQRWLERLTKHTIKFIRLLRENQMDTLDDLAE